MATSNSGVRVRDLDARKDLSLSTTEIALRVPYDVFRVEGSVEVHDGLMSYMEGGKRLEGRTKETPLGECKPGERVLVRDTALAKAPLVEASDEVTRDVTQDEPETPAEGAWTLCEVLEVRGHAVA